MKTYEGFATTGTVQVTEYDDSDMECPPQTWELNPRLDIRNHSPTGFAWGYHGSGPAQLSLALVADATGDDQLAVTVYQRFKEHVIAQFNQDHNFLLRANHVADWALKFQHELNPVHWGKLDARNEDWTGETKNCLVTGRLRHLWLSGYHLQKAAPYPAFCSTPEKCALAGRCTRDPVCND